MRGPLGGPAMAWNVAADAVEQARELPEVAATMRDIDVGETPSEVVYTENKLRLLRYEPLTEQQYDVPILVVYALINRPYVLDLQPDRSVVRRLLERGFEVYLIDWGEPSTLDASLTLEDYVNRYIDNCVDVVCEDAGVDNTHILGYCMGGTMSAMYAALHPEKVRTLALMAASLYFEDTGGVLEQWGAAEHYSPETVEETFGTVPAEFFDAGFALMDPVENSVSKYAHLMDNLDDEEFLENFARMERWLADGIDMSGAVYRQYIQDIYQENRFAENELTLGDSDVDLQNITMPVLQIVAEYDHLVPPEASLPFNDVVPSEDIEEFEIATGHIGLSVSRTAHEQLWPAVGDWFAARSGPEPTEEPGEDETALERVSGIGPQYADRLRDAGVSTLAALADADPDELAASVDVSGSRLADWIAQARELVDST